MNKLENLLRYLINEESNQLKLFIAWLLGTCSKRIGIALLRIAKKGTFKLKEYYRKHISVNLDKNELADIKEKVAANKQLKPFEKKAYVKHKEIFERHRKQFMEKNHLTDESMEQLKNIKLKKKKMVFTPKGTILVDDEEEHE